MWYSFCGRHGAILMSYVCGVECHFIPDKQRSAVLSGSINSLLVFKPDI